jgi:hypothetical protein
MANWYIKSRDTEDWKTASLVFRNWLTNRNVIGSFGYSEGEGLVYEGARFHCFCVPDKHGDNVFLPREWAEATGRIYGTEVAGGIEIHTPRA